ncbi:MAG: hypothetical protein ACXAC5_01815 [Promethearchaeota archaeon]|jgi:hypothetical protein
MAKVTGYQLRESLRCWTDKRDVLSRNFQEAIWQFEDEKSGNPVEIAIGYHEADKAIARLEAAQQEFNQRVAVSLPDGSTTLAIAVKRVGGSGRLAKMWRNAATSTGRDRYSYRENRRSKDDVFATRQVTQDLAMKQADEASRYASALRAAIAEANSKEIEIENLDPSLLN